MKTKITAYDDITLITLPDIPADNEFIYDIFEKIAERNIDMDMISLSPVQSEKTSLSFTINDEDLVNILSFTSKLEQGSVRPVVSSGNCKISIDDEGMEHCPGVAAKVFRTVAASRAELRLITTSEAQISLLVTKSDFDKLYADLTAQFIDIS